MEGRGEQVAWGSLFPSPRCYPWMSLCIKAVPLQSGHAQARGKGRKTFPLWSLLSMEIYSCLKNLKS